MNIPGMYCLKIYKIRGLKFIELSMFAKALEM